MILIQENIQDNVFGAASAPYLEKEYLTKLDLLAQKYLEKRPLKEK